MTYKFLPKNAVQAAELLKTLGNEWRLLILCSLQEGEKSVGSLEMELGLRQSALSQHLARLRRDGLVTTRRDAQTIFYSISNESAMGIVDALETAFTAGRVQT